jgi:hypothetical protein
MRGNLRPITPRSSPAIARPAAAPKGTSRPRGATNAMPQAQPNESARCTGTAASSRRPRCVAPGRRIEPAASDASSGSPPRSSASAIEGAPLRTAAHAPAAVPSRSALAWGVYAVSGHPSRMQREARAHRGFAVAARSAADESGRRLLKASHRSCHAARTGHLVEPAKDRPEPPTQPSASAEGQQQSIGLDNRQHRR